MMATNMPEALDEALLRPGPHRPHLQGRLPVARPAASAPTRATSTRSQHELTAEQIDKLATITPYATGATIKDLVNEALDHRDPRRPRGRHLGATSSRRSSSRTSARPRTSSTSSASGTPSPLHEACHAVVAYRDAAAPATSTSRRSRRAATTSAWSRVDPARGPVHPVALRVRGRHHGLASRRSPASGCSSSGDNSSGVSGDLEIGDRSSPPSWRATGAWVTPCRRTPRRGGSRSAARAAAAAARRRARTPRRCCGRAGRPHRGEAGELLDQAEEILRENRPRCWRSRTPWRRTRR